MSRRQFSLAVSVGALVLLCIGGMARAETLQVRAAGIEIGLTIEQDQARASGDTSVATVSLRDATTGNPITGARPAAWMQLRRSEQAADELSCEMKAKQLSSGSLGARADADLNTYRLLTLNDDNTVAFINPFVRLNNSRLEAIVQLPSRGYDWVLSRRQQRLFVNLRDTGQVAVIDVTKRKLIKTLELGTSAQPTRLVFDEDSETLWVGLDASKGIVAINAKTLALIAQVEVGAGLHTFALAANTPWLFVTNSDANTVSIVDRARFIKLADVPVGRSPVSVAWSEAAQRAVVASIVDGEVTLVDAETAKVANRLQLQPGIIATALFDEGRFALVANHQQSVVTLLDLATPRIVDRIPVASQPDQMVLTKQFAFVRGQASPQMTMLSLVEARAGKLAATRISMGKSSPVEVAAGVNVASALVAAPEGNGVYLANVGDQTIYRYTEGLMAANGSFSNYRRGARGVMVHDASLAETTSGVFAAPFRVPQPGRYDVVVRNARPAVVACFVATISSPNANTGAALQTMPLVSVRSLNRHPTGGYALVIEVVERARAVQPRDAQLLVMSPRTGWQERINLLPVAGDVSLQARVALPADVRPTELHWLVAAPSLGLRFSDGKLVLPADATIASQEARE